MSQNVDAKQVRAFIDQTTTPLAASGSWTSQTFDAMNFKTIMAKVFTNVAGTALYIDYSDDGVTFDPGASTSVTSGTVLATTFNACSRYVRFRIVAGATTQTQLRATFWAFPI